MTADQRSFEGLATKWRPGLGLVLILVLGTILALPLAGLFVFRIYDNQLVRQTEGELVAQAAVLAAAARHEIETTIPAEIPLGEPVHTETAIAPGTYRPIPPDLDLATIPLLPPRPEPIPATRPADAAFKALGERMMPILIETQRVTLAGFRLLDPQGVVIAGRDEVGMSLAHIQEVGEALRGHFADVLRRRVSKHARPPLGSISRGTPVRVFVAMPIVVRQHVAGAIYASRTPDDILDGLYALRRPLGLAAASVFAAAALIGFVLYRTISVPVRDLIRLTGVIGDGDREAARIPPRHGTVEFAALSRSFRTMAARLTERSEAVSTFAVHVSHELKSPLTSIRGAAELLRDDVDSNGATMSDDDRRRFLDHIVADAARLDALLRRLRDMARAEGAASVGTATLRPAIEALQRASTALDIVGSGQLDEPLRMSAETVLILLSHIADNAGRHGATRLDVEAHRDGAMMRITLRDDGEGILPANRGQVFEPFFTTRRESGGTGMGLAIVRALLDAHGGSIALLDNATGAAFAVCLPSGSASTDAGKGPAGRRRFLVRPVFVAGVIAAGLALRGFGPGAGLPFVITKYGGSILWGAMVYGLVTLAWPNAGRLQGVSCALAIAIAIEVSRLVATPTLDAFRLTPLGALLLGRVFSPWDVLAYRFGIVLAACFDARRLRRGRATRVPPSQ